MILRTLIFATFLAGTSLAIAADAQRQTATPCPTQTTNKAQAPDCQKTTGLLLPAVQKVQATDSKPQRATRTLKARDFDRLLMQHHRSGRPIPGEKSAANPSSGAATQLASPKSAPPKYEIADCGEGQVCCSYGGENSTCNLFMYLCESQGGSATGDKNEAVCTF